MGPYGSNGSSQSSRASQSAFRLVAISSRSVFQLINQRLAIHQESFASLVAAEAVEQLDSLPAFDAEEFFDRGAVEDGDLEQADLVENPGNLKQPLRLRRHGKLSLFSQRYHTVVRKSIFSA